MGKQYAQPERGRRIHQVESDYPPGNCHAFHSERPRDRFLAFNSSPEQQQYQNQTFKYLMHRYSCHETHIRMAKQIVPESNTKSIHDAVQTEGDHEHQRCLCQLRACLFKVVYRASRTDAVDILADDPKKKISAGAGKKESWPCQELFGIRQYVKQRNRQQCAHRGSQQAESMQRDLPKCHAERFSGERKQSRYGWMQKHDF